MRFGNQKQSQRGKSKSWNANATTPRMGYSEQALIRAMALKHNCPFGQISNCPLCAFSHLCEIAK